MKVNEISLKELRPYAVEWFTQLHQTLLIYFLDHLRKYIGTKHWFIQIWKSQEVFWKQWVKSNGTCMPKPPWRPCPNHRIPGPLHTFTPLDIVIYEKLHQCRLSHGVKQPSQLTGFYTQMTATLVLNTKITMMATSRK